MKCLPSPNGVICYAEVQDATVTDRNGRVWHFDFDERFGPLVVTKRGDSVKEQPGERSAFWPAFQAWHDARRGLAPKCEACRGEGSVVTAQLSRRVSIAASCKECGGTGRQRKGGR